MVAVAKNDLTSPFCNFIKKAAIVAVGGLSLAAITHVALSAIGVSSKAILAKAGTALAGAFTATNILLGTHLLLGGVTITATIAYAVLMLTE